MPWKLMAVNEVQTEHPVAAFSSGSRDAAAPSEEAVRESQNGMAVCQTDRFGFCGGHQYTDPTRYV